MNCGCVRIITSPSQTADAVDFDADQNRVGAFHSAIVGHYLQDVVVVLFVIQRLSIPDHTYNIPERHFKIESS